MDIDPLISSKSWVVFIRRSSVYKEGGLLSVPVLTLTSSQLASINTYSQRPGLGLLLMEPVTTYQEIMTPQQQAVAAFICYFTVNTRVKRETRSSLAHLYLKLLVFV